MSNSSNLNKKKSMSKLGVSSSSESKEEMIDEIIQFRKEVDIFTEKVIEMSESLEYPNHFTGHILCLIPYLVLQAYDRNDFVKAAIWGASLAKIFIRNHPKNMNMDQTSGRIHKRINYDHEILRHLKALAEYDIEMPDVD